MRMCERGVGGGEDVCACRVVLWGVCVAVVKVLGGQRGVCGVGVSPDRQVSHASVWFCVVIMSRTESTGTDDLRK